MKIFQLLMIYFFSLSLSSCSQDTTYVEAFKGTKSYDLAIAVEDENLDAIEKYRAFEKLLELGANANYSNTALWKSV